MFGTLLTQIPRNGKITITAPNEVTVNSGSLTCSFVIILNCYTCLQVIPSNALISSCTASSRTITIILNSVLQADAFEVHINNVLTNPMSTSPTSSFQIATTNTADQPLDQLTTSITLTATEGLLQTQSLTPVSQVVGATTNLEVRFKATHDIPIGSIIRVSFPKWNPLASNPSEYFQGGISCTTVAVLQASLQCAFASSTISVTGAFSTKITGGTEVAFLVTSFRNPISTETISGFTILLTDSSGGNIDRGTVTLKVSQAATITGGSINVDSSVTDTTIAGIVQETNKMRLTFTSPVPLNQNCVVKVSLPSQFSVSTINSVLVSGLFGIQTTITPTKTSSDNSFTFTQCTSYTSNTLAANIVIDALKLPNYNKATNSFTITISTFSGSIIAQVSSGITFTANAGRVSSITLEAQNAVILAPTGIQFNIVPKHTLDVATRAVIQFPSTYVLGTQCTLTPIQNVNVASGCTFSGQTVTISNLFTTAYIGGSGQLIQFRINTITLPQTNETANGMVVNLLNQDSSDSQFYIVDSYTGSVPILFGYGTFTRAVATPGSVNAFAVTTCTFEFSPEHYIPQNGYIQIVYPMDISIPDTSYSQSSCSDFSTTFPSAPSCVITAASRTIQINNGFRTTTIPPGGTLFSFKIPGIQNPINLGVSNSFIIKTFTQSGAIMDYKDSGISVTMTQTAVMRSVLVTLGSYVNAATTSYTFTITASVPVTEDNYVIIKFPTQISLPTSESSLACRSDDTAIFNEVKCYLNSAQSSNSVRVALDLRSSLSQINILQTFKITVNGIKNPTSTEETSDFNIQITDKTFKSINQSPTGIRVSTNTAYTLLKSSLKQNTTGAGQPAQYNITLYPENDIEIGGGIYLVYPSQITQVSSSIPITVKVISPYTKSTPKVEITVSARQIMIRDAFQLKVVGATVDDTILIVIEGFKNPLVNNITTSFEVKTFNEKTVNSRQVYYYIDQVLSGLVLNSPCDYPCALCSANNPSNCTSCYSTATLNKLQGGTCVAECSVGKYFNSQQGTCQDCAFPCLGCSNSATNCTVCGLQDYLYLHNNACRQDCPSGFVTDSKNNKCAKCSSECSTCELTTSTCTSCTTSTGFPYLYQSTCLKTCPASLTITQPGVCLNCDPMCKTCSGTTTSCSSCYSYMRYDPAQKSCLAACTPDTQIYNQTTGLCLNCDDNCLTCSGNTTTCTSCRGSSVLNTDNKCRDKCSAIDQIPINNVCKQCELPCSQCKGSLNHCTKCQGEYLLYNTTCVQYCPEKYEANNVTSQCILVGLICPEGFTVNEAGDGCIPNEFECPEGYQINTQRTACVPKPGSAVPFPFLIFSVILSLLVLGSYIKDKFFTKVYSNLIALLSFQEMLMYLLILAYSGANGVWGAFALSLIGVLMLMTANIIFYLYYKREVMQDDIFAKWQRSYPKTSKYIPMICLFVNFKCVRLFYSGFYGLESCLAQFEDPMKNLFRPLRMITYFNYVFVYIPIFIADIIVFADVKWGYQLLVLAIETFLLIIAIIVLTYFEFRNMDKLIIRGDEQYSRIKPKYFNGESMVMAGMIDVDESTLIRTKVVDDDYEIFLRKKAFVSILQQVEKNYMNAQQKGLDLGGKLDQVMSKFDTKRLKLRRAFSLEEIKEDESWYIPSDNENNDDNTKKPSALYTDNVDDEDDGMINKQRRYSYPLSPKSRETVPDPQFRQAMNDIKSAQATTKEKLVNNVYAECKAPDKNKEKNRRKTVSRRTQTYLRELLQLEGDELHESDLEIIMEDDAEIDLDYTKDLIDGVIDGLSESESNVGGIGKKRAKKKRKNLNTKRQKEIPDFELADIMGDFEIDDLGNFIILRGEKGELLDKKERRVNRRGYLIDRFGNIINKQGQVIFKAVELDSDDEIPAPFGFEKRKKNLLNLGQDGEFKIQGNDKEIEDDEDLIDRELRMMRKAAKKKNKMDQNGQILEEEDDNDDESSVDSLMAESPGKYQIDQLGDNEDEIIANVTKKKVPVKRGQHRSYGKKQNLRAADDLSAQESQRKKAGPLQNLPPKRIKKDDTKDLFPSLNIEASEQKKLFKIAEQIGGMANQIAESQKKNLNQSQISNQDHLEQLKQEHFKDLMQDQTTKSHKPPQVQQSDKKLPPKPNMEKIYGNLGDVVNYEEQLLKEQYKGLRAQSPFSSQITTRMGFRPEASTIAGDKRRLKGLESIYLQKFDKKAGIPNPKKQLQKAKFRNTLTQFVDDPEMLVDDGLDRMREREMSLQVADKLDRLQRQYMSNTTTNNFKNLQSSSSMGFQPTVGAAVIRKNGSLSGSMFNQDPSLEPIKKGNWVQRD